MNMEDEDLCPCGASLCWTCGECEAEDCWCLMDDWDEYEEDEDES